MTVVCDYVDTMTMSTLDMLIGIAIIMVATVNFQIGIVDKYRFADREKAMMIQRGASSRRAARARDTVLFAFARRAGAVASALLTRISACRGKDVGRVSASGPQASPRRPSARQARSWRRCTRSSPSRWGSRASSSTSSSARRCSAAR